MFRKFLSLWLICAVSISNLNIPAALAEADVQHEEVVVTGTGYDAGPFMPEYSGAQIYSGKKTSSHSLAKLPAMQPDQYRQAFTQIPGLLISEVAVPSIVNLSYRGLNDPHESNGLLVMKDGLPVLSDWHGYPTLYYSPPLEAVERVEFIRGGSSLLYGPQPGPALNYVTYDPPAEKFVGETKHTFGSNSMYSTFNSLGGTYGPVGYYGYYHHRQADGERDNSDYAVHSGNFKTVLKAGETSKLTANFDAYDSESGEAGRLTYAQWAADPEQTTRVADRLWIDRYTGSLTYEQEITGSGLLTIKPWVGYQDRLSRRQTADGAFTNNLDRQEFTYTGVDNRMRWLWDLFGKEQVLTGGFLFYHSDAPRNRRRGLERESNDGVEIFSMDRSTDYWALFAEQLFKWWRLSIVPAFRLELISLKAEEEFNSGVTRPLIDEDFMSAVPLFGLGVGLDLGKRNELYFNVSQGYQPKEYDDLVNPTSNTQRAPQNLDESKTWNYEVGFRGTPATWFSYDTSLFFIDYDNYIESQNIGGGNVERSNSGHAQFGGWEAAAQADVIGFWDDVRQSKVGETIGSFGPFGNIQLLDAKFTGGVNDGNEPAYSPEYLVKWGLTYHLKKWFKATLSSVFAADHYWQDSNAAGAVGIREVTAYKVWDLALEAYLYKDILSIFGGASNLFDETYFSRVRSDGIEPANGRDIYGGFRVKFAVA